MSTTYAQPGIADQNDAANPYNQIDRHIRALLALIPGSTLVQVVAVTNTPGQVAPIGKVDVLPIINQVNGAGTPTPHGIVNGLPYARIQGGANAIIVDPQVNDIGIAVFASRDTSSAKANFSEGATGNAQVNPGSARQNSYSDGVYLFTVLAKTPTQWIAITSTGFDIADINGNTMTSGPTGWLINGALINLAGDVITKAGHDLDTHVHSGVQTGGSDTGPPV